VRIIWQRLASFLTGQIINGANRRLRWKLGFCLGYMPGSRLGLLAKQLVAGERNTHSHTLPPMIVILRSA
jgi:hypothetical protein